MNSTKLIMLWIPVAFLLYGCVGTKMKECKGSELLKMDHTVSIGKKGLTVKVLYTGCGGLAIGTDNNLVVVDPYYTGHNGFRVATGIKPDPANAEKVFSVIDKNFNGNKVSAALITHSHYDHLEDLPWIILNNKIADKGMILGSPTASSILSGLMRGRMIVNNAEIAYRQNGTGSANGQWKNLNSQMRVLAIESDHAPHLGKIHAMRCKKKCRKSCCCEHGKGCERPECKFYCGTKDCPAYLDNIGTDKRTSARKWKEGSTYTYLLDVFGTSNRDTVRIFIMTSAANSPNGFPSEAELKKKKVDLAILCTASYKWVDNYPEDILTRLGKPATMFIHWENFFRDMYKENPRIVPGTNMKKLMARLRTYFGVSSNADLQKFMWVQKPLGVVKVER